MKLVKYFILLLLLLIAAISVFVATKNGKFTKQKSIYIKVPKKVAYDYLVDSKNWDTINPWQKENKVSKPTIKIDDVTLSKEIVLNGVIYFIQFKFKDTLQKQTILKWTTSGNLSFEEKLLNLLNKGHKNNFGQKFDVGLAIINKILTTETNSFSYKIDGLVQLDTIFYIQKVLSCKSDELATKLKTALLKLEKLLSNTNTFTNGKPFLVYHSKDSLANTINFSAAIPTKRKVFTTVESDIFTGQINPYQAVKATLIGNYSHKNEVYKELYRYIIMNKLTQNTSIKIIEIMPVNPATEKFASRWITEIYIPVKTLFNANKTKRIKKTLTDTTATAKSTTSESVEP